MSHEPHSGSPTSRSFVAVLVPVLCALIGFLTALALVPTLSQAYAVPSAPGGRWTPRRLGSANTTTSSSDRAPQQSLLQLQQIEKQLQEEVNTLQSVSKLLQQNQQGRPQSHESAGADAVHLAAIQQQADNIEAAGQSIAEQQTQLLQMITELHTASAQSQAQTAAAPATAAAKAASSRASGVICTVLRDEAEYVSEWVAFHLLVGATKIVIYDDNSTDALQAAVAPFGSAVDIIRLQDTPSVPRDSAVHRVAARQDWAFDHCKRNYASNSSVGWFGIWDIDEFIFPCKRPAAAVQGNMLWDAWTSSTKGGSDAHKLRCNVFGANHEDQPQGDGQLVLMNNLWRAADHLLEPEAAALSDFGTRQGCSECGCCQDHGSKTIYDISRVPRLALWTHGTHTQDAVVDRSVGRPIAGICCNHYQFKSTKESADKSEANLNTFYQKVATTPDAKKYYTMVQDTLIWQYVPELVDFLQAKHVEVKMPRTQAIDF